MQEAIAMRGRVRTARAARLATIDPDGRPHLVPIVFVGFASTAVKRLAIDEGNDERALLS